MYEAYFGFTERPFSLLPDPDFLFPSSKHQAALDTLELAIYSESAFCVLSGEIGAGKTTVLRELLNRLGEDLCVGLVSNTHPSFGELLQWVAAAFELPCQHRDKTTLHESFVDFVISRYAANQRTLLVVDEAQNLSGEALEELRMLSNVNSDKDFVLQILLVGQPELRAKLRQPELRQFAQRIALDYHLEALDAEETRAYIRHRLRHAGGDPGLFSDAACQAVAGYAMGVPRLINRLCDLALVYAYAEKQGSIGDELIERVAMADGRLSPIRRPRADDLERPVPAGDDQTREPDGAPYPRSDTIAPAALADAPVSGGRPAFPSRSPAPEPAAVASGPGAHVPVPPGLAPERDCAAAEPSAATPGCETQAAPELGSPYDQVPVEVDLYPLFADAQLRVAGWDRARGRRRSTRWLWLLALLVTGGVGALTHESWVAPARGWIEQFTFRAWAAGRGLVGLEVPRRSPEPDDRRNAVGARPIR